MPAAVDPEKSYIDRVKIRDGILNIRSHLTFLATNPAKAATGVKAGLAGRWTFACLSAREADGLARSRSADWLHHVEIHRV